MQIPPLKTPFRHFGNHFGPWKSDIWPFYWFWSFSHWNSHRSRRWLNTNFIKTRPKIGLKWCASCGSFALSTISIVLSPADWYLNTFSFVIFLPDVSDNTINQHSPVEMQCNLLRSFHLMNPFPIRILFFPIINNHVSPKRSILRHPALLSVCVNDHRPTFISR